MGDRRARVDVSEPPDQAGSHPYPHPRPHLALILALILALTIPADPSHDANVQPLCDAEDGTSRAREAGYNTAPCDTPPSAETASRACAILNEIEIGKSCHPGKIAI